MTKFTYWDNSKTWHGKVLFEVIAENIVEADKIFQENFGYSPYTKSNVGATLDQIPKITIAMHST
jgi:hypothetical protein